MGFIIDTSDEQPDPALPVTGHAIPYCGSAMPSYPSVQNSRINDSLFDHLGRTSACLEIRHVTASRSGHAEVHGMDYSEGTGMSVAGSQTLALAKTLRDKCLDGAPGVTRTRDLLIRSQNQLPLRCTLQYSGIP